MVGKADNAVPEQMAATGVNVGVVFAFTVTVKFVDVAHCPPVGKNVYVVVAVLFNGGDQVPDIPFSDVVGNADNTDPEQMAATGVKTGVTFALIVIVNVVDDAHWPAAGVKV